MRAQRRGLQGEVNLAYVIPSFLTAHPPVNKLENSAFNNKSTRELVKKVYFSNVTWEVFVIGVVYLLLLFSLFFIIKTPGKATTGTARVHLSQQHY